MSEDEITFDALPKAVAYLIDEIATLKSLVQSKPNAPESRRPIGIDDACKLIHKAKPTLYTLVRKRLIPCYKNGKRLYFYEDELLEWIAKGRRKSSHELRSEIEQEMSQIGRGRPRNSQNS